MSKLDELIKEYCPNGVHYKSLNSLASIKTGKGITKKDIKENGIYPIISGGKKPMGFYDIYNREKNCITVSRVGANAGYVDFIECKFYLNDKCFSVIPLIEEINTKYMFYFLKSKERALRLLQSEGGVPTINTKKLGNIKIPVPPLPVQEEIVRILDEYSTANEALKKKLEEELTARKKQYAYYLDFMTNANHFISTSKFKTVGELFDFKNGLNKGKEFFGHGTPIINFTDVYNNKWLNGEMIKGLVDVDTDELERYKVKKGDVFFTRTSETKEDIGKACTVIEDVDNCVFSGFVLRARPLTNLLLPKFCAYFFSSTKVRNEIIRYSSFTTRATITGAKLSKIKVPILPLEIQKKIADTLDNFDAICSDLNIGLPAEIEARQKQYEYYRDALLTFAETGDIIDQTDRTLLD